MPAARYRPRQPRASPIWQILDGHWADFRRNEAVHDDHLNQTVQAFLRCGDFRSGFTRWRCPDCAQEFLLAFTCKQRGLCATCAQRRTLTLAPYIAETVCHAVPHRHIVLTIPRVLRPVFRRNRALLTELFHAAHEVLGLWLRERTGGADGQPGIVIAAQTFGDFLSWHPHLHLLVTAGVFRADNTFALASPGGWRQLAELWRHAVLRRLLKHQAINDNLAEKLLSWNHSGFNLDAGEAPLAMPTLPGSASSARNYRGGNGHPGDPDADRHVEPPGGTPTSSAGIRLTGRSGHRAIAFGREGNVTRGSPPLAFKIGTSGLAAICLRRVYHRPRGRLRSVRM